MHNCLHVHVLLDSLMSVPFKLCFQNFTEQLLPDCHYKLNTSNYNSCYALVKKIHTSRVELCASVILFILPCNPE